MSDDLAGDELDPTLPTYYTEDDEDFVVDAADGEDPDAQPEEWTLEQGFVDATGTVRLYTDEQGNPVRIGLARYWRDQIKTVPLADMFNDVFLQAAVLLGRAPVNLPVAEEVDIKDQLTPELLDRMAEQMNELEARMAELRAADEGYSQTQGQQVVGRGAEGRVELTLTMYGTPQAVSFDQKWLKEATMAEVTGGVIAAYKDARANFTEPVFLPGERHMIASKYMTIADTILASVRNGLVGIEPVEPAEFPEHLRAPKPQHTPEETKK